MPSKVLFQIVVILSMLFCPWVAQAALAPGMAAQIVSLQGSGELRPNATASWTAAKGGEALVGGAFVRTLDSSKMALLLADDTQIRLNQNSVLQISRIGSAQEETNLLLSIGRAWAQFRHDHNRRLTFATPSATAGIRGTDWELDVDASGKTMLTVFSGEVAFFNAQGSVTVSSNEAAVAEVGRAPVKILLSNPRERIQWVNALSANPLRHLDVSQVPATLQPTFSALQKGDLQQAKAALVSAPATAAPADWRSLLTSAQAMLSGDTAAAKQQLAALLAQSAQPPVAAWLLLSDLLLLEGNFDQAAITLEKVLVSTPDHPDLLAQLARAQMLADKLTQSEQTLTRPRRADTVSVLLAQGDLARRQGQTEATLQAYRRSTEVAPQDDRGWFGLGSAHNELEQSTPARANLQQALALQPQGPGYQGELGTLETFANRFTEAEQAFAVALAHNPADYVALTGLGLLRLKQGQPQAALDAFLRAGVMEPRYARAKAYTAVAYYQLGSHQDAIDTLRGAALLDDKDPIPYLFLSQIFTDLLRPGDAIQASRDALQRLPYLKSLNQIANDQKGSANFGAALAFFGLEDWALELAQSSYTPYWGGSHLFLADRYHGEFNKNSELFQGYLSDPLAFGASNRFSSLLQRAGHYSMLEFNYDKAAFELFAPLLTLNGLSNSSLPIAYFAQVLPAHARRFPIDMSVSSNMAVFEDPSGRADIDAGVITLGLGLQPTDKLGLFAYHNAFRVKLQGTNSAYDPTPGHASLTGPTLFDIAMRQTALGLSYRWTPTSQTWFKIGSSKTENTVTAYPSMLEQYNIAMVMGVNATPNKQFDDVQLRHTVDISAATRLSAGLEHVHETQTSQALGMSKFRLDSAGVPNADYWLVFSGSNNIGREFSGLTLSAQHQVDGNRLLLDASLTGNRLSETVQGENALGLVGYGLIDSANVNTRQTHYTTAPRLGLAYQPNEQLSLRAAYQDWVRPLSVNTLGSVATAGIALEDRFVQAGGRTRRSVLQLGWTPNAQTYLSAKFDHQDILNPTAPGVDLRTPSMPFLETLRNTQNVNLSNLDLLEETPDVEDGRLDSLTLALNRLLTQSLSGYVKYVWQDSRNSYADSNAPGGRSEEKRIAYLPRDTLALGLSWAGGQQTQLGTRVVYRSNRYEDVSNMTLWPANWSLDLLAIWQTADKHWNLGLGALNLGGSKSSRQFERYVFDARYRF